MGNESLSNRELTVILLTIIIALLKPTITTEEKHTEYFFEFAFLKCLSTLKPYSRKYMVGVGGNKNTILFFSRKLCFSR